MIHCFNAARKSAAVLVNVSEYQRMIDKIDLMEELIEAEQQIASGEVVSHEEATIYIQTVWHDRQEPHKSSSGLR